MKATAAIFSIAIALITLTGCGGGGGDGSVSTDGLVLEGSLTQGSESSHARIATKHSEGEPLESIEICALGSCSTTDATGHWGFLVEGAFTGGDVQFTVNGHGISASPIFHVPEGAENVVFELVHSGGVVSATSITVDGVEHSTVHETEESHHEE